MDNIQITLPDGAIRDVPRGTTAGEIARQISPRLAKEALVARANGDLVDLNRPLEQDTKISILTAKDPDAVQVFRHSAAHLLGAAVLELYPQVKLGVGPPIETGFFYEFLRPEPFTQADLEAIETRMHEIAARDLANERKLIPKAEALELYRNLAQTFKCELVDEKATDPMVSFYQTGKFLDFCLGPHIPSTGRITAFKLMNVAGAYWKGQEGNPQMQRIYGACFPTQAELDEYLHKLEEAKRRDHRKLGAELDLFSIQDEAGPGLIFWHPKGGMIRKQMEDWLRDELLRRGYDLVFTPHVMRLDLWKTSGHANFYRENMFNAMEVEKADYQLKPMNCPGHILIYKSRLRSYRELPVRLAELGTVYRYERSGVLHGLLRVRGFTQDDAHIFCMPEQIEQEVEACVEFAWEVLRVFGFDRYEVELSAARRHPARGLRRNRGRMGTGGGSIDRHADPYEGAVQIYAGRSGVLRPENRCKAGGCDRAAVATDHRAIRFQFAAAIRAGIRGRGWRRASTLDGASRAVGIGGAVFRGTDRTFRGRLSGMAGSGAGHGTAGEREILRIRAEGDRGFEGGGVSRASGRPQRKATGKNPRRADGQSSRTC